MRQVLSFEGQGTVTSDSGVKMPIKTAMVIECEVEDNMVVEIYEIKSLNLDSLTFR